MDVDWRSLFDAIRVPWRDRGANTSRKNVNICCPFCRDDQGFHMGVAEDGKGYFCFRRSGEHSGSNFVRLLVRLGQGRLEAIRLLNEYQSLHQRARAAPIPIPVDKQTKAWENFSPLGESDRQLDYLYSRGFDDPETVAERYDLRFSRAGKWAGRLLLPFRDIDGGLRGWTGRALQKDTQPRYLTQESGVEGLLYIPRAPRALLIAVEGPLDALKLAVAGEPLPIAVAALTGKHLSEPRLWRLRHLMRASTSFRLCLDADTGFLERQRMLAELRGIANGEPVQRLILPEGYKDAGEMPLTIAAQWLRGIAI